MVECWQAPGRLRAPCNSAWGISYLSFLHSDSHVQVGVVCRGGFRDSYQKPIVTPRHDKGGLSGPKPQSSLNERTLARLPMVRGVPSGPVPPAAVRRSSSGAALGMPRPAFARLGAMRIFSRCRKPPTWLFLVFLGILGIWRSVGTSTS